MNKLLLNLALLPAGLWKRMGADTEQLRAMLDVKLMLDNRRPVSFGGARQQKRNHRYSIAVGMLTSFFTGIIYIMPLILFRDVLLSLSLFFAFFLFLLTFTLITDFSTVLIDTRDKFILLPRPVNDRTLFLSRLLHVFIYLFRIVLPMSLPGWIVLGIMHGWKAVVWFPVPLMLVVFTALFLVMGAYLLILRIAPPNKFKDILGYFQIFISIIVFASFYLTPRAINSEELLTMSLRDFPWIKGLPPFWIASTWSWIHPHAVAAGTIWYSILAIALPAVALWITVRFFAPQFAARLGELDASEGTPAPVASRQPAKGSKLYERLMPLLNKRPEAQAGFMIVWLQTARSRSFKMKIFPLFAYVPIYFVYIMFQSKTPLNEMWAALPKSSKHLGLLYMSSVVAIQALSMIIISEQYKAAWVYYATPLKEPGGVFAGAFKAVMIKYFLPFFSVIAVFVLAVWGAGAILDVLLALVNVVLFAACICRIGVRVFPFSRIDQMSNSGSKTLKVFMSMLVPFVLGVMHYLASSQWWLEVLFMILSGILLWLIWDSYSRTRWSDMKEEAL
jgi:ABC-2 type transport system permease protein